MPFPSLFHFAVCSLFLLFFYYSFLFCNVWGYFFFFFFCGRKTKNSEQKFFFLTVDFRLSTFHVSHFLFHINKLFSFLFISPPSHLLSINFLLFNRIDSMHYVSHEKSTNDEFNTLWEICHIHEHVCWCCKLILVVIFHSFQLQK